MKPKPLSVAYLLARGSCCGSGCTNCPYLSELGERREKGSVLRNERLIVKLIEGFQRRSKEK